ncbi:M48 family metallopeptidase [Yinghuangia aomiensis]
MRGGRTHVRHGQAARQRRRRGAGAGNAPARQRTGSWGIRRGRTSIRPTAVVALRKINGFDLVLKQLSGMCCPSVPVRLAFLAGSDAGRATSSSAELHEMCREAAAILDMPSVPEKLYVTLDPQPNAMAIGMDRPFIVVTTGLVELTDDDEMRTVVGHEMGRIPSGRAVYRTMLLILTNLATSLSGIPLGTIGIQALIAGLREWFRKSELPAATARGSARRAGPRRCRCGRS